MGSESESLPPILKQEDKSLDWAEEEWYNNEQDEDFVMNKESRLGEESDGNGSAEGNSEESNVNLNQDIQAVQNENTDFVLHEFSEWLNSCDGGEKKIESVRQVFTIIAYVDPNNQNVASLMKRVDVLVITKTGKENNQAPYSPTVILRKF